MQDRNELQKCDYIIHCQGTNARPGNLHISLKQTQERIVIVFLSKYRTVVHIAISIWFPGILLSIQILGNGMHIVRCNILTKICSLIVNTILLQFRISIFTRQLLQPLPWWSIAMWILHFRLITYNSELNTFYCTVDTCILILAYIPLNTQAPFLWINESPMGYVIQCKFRL